MPTQLIPTGVTVELGSNNTDLATTAYVDRGLALKADNTDLTTHNTDNTAHATKFANYTETINSPMFNKRDIITTSGTYTAPITGWYKITIKGGGGGGSAGFFYNNTFCTAGGGEGGKSIGYEKFTKNQVISVTVGAGGTGGDTGTQDSKMNGKEGGDTYIKINNNIKYIAYGGTGGLSSSYGTAGEGGNGDIKGCCGHNLRLLNIIITDTAPACPGGGSGANYGNITAAPQRSSINGGGGVGGCLREGSGRNGGDGGAGYVWFEYFDDSLN